MVYNVIYCIFAACNAVFGEFADSYRSAVIQNEVFEPLTRYERICEDNVALLKKLAKRSVPSHARYTLVLFHYHLFSSVSDVRIWLIAVC